MGPVAGIGGGGDRCGRRTRLLRDLDADIMELLSHSLSLE